MLNNLDLQTLENVIKQFCFLLPFESQLFIIAKFESECWKEGMDGFAFQLFPSFDVKGLLQLQLRT